MAIAVATGFVVLIVGAMAQGSQGQGGTKTSGGLRIFRVPLQLSTMTYQPVLILVLGSLATFRLSHLMTKERGPLAVFKQFRNALPGGRGSAKEWLSCIWCFSLTGQRSDLSDSLGRRPSLELGLLDLSWLSFSSVSLLINRACRVAPVLGFFFPHSRIPPSASPIFLPS